MNNVQIERERPSTGNGKTEGQVRQLRHMLPGISYVMKYGCQCLTVTKGNTGNNLCLLDL